MYNRGVMTPLRRWLKPPRTRLADRPQPLPPEITLRLDQPLTGKPALNRQLRWEGVPADFSASPFMLTMQTETAKIDGLQTSACAPARKRQ